jgi:hypothetical protein
VGRQATNFALCLGRAGLEVLDRGRRKVAQRGKATTKELPSEVRGELLELYWRFGGRTTDQSFTTGDWDIVCANDLLVEYDEEAHFNRYRVASIDLSWSDQLPRSMPYRKHSAAQELICRKKKSYGGYWLNDSTERMFGPSDPPSVLGALGSSRWKQRAFYDAIKDAYVLFVPDVQLARVPMYDEIGGVTAGSTVKRTPGLNQEALRGHLLSMTVPS